MKHMNELMNIIYGELNEPKVKIIIIILVIWGLGASNEETK